MSALPPLPAKPLHRANGRNGPMQTHALQKMDEILTQRLDTLQKNETQSEFEAGRSTRPRIDCVAEAVADEVE
jgi:hypothetical protein